MNFIKMLKVSDKKMQSKTTEGNVSTDSTSYKNKYRLHAHCRNGNVQFWVALFVKVNNQIDDVALQTVDEF